MLCPLAPFIQHLSWRRSLGQAETIELSDARARGRFFPDMPRHCGKAYVQKIFSLQKPGPAEVAGQNQHITAVMCTYCPDTRVQPASGIPWRQNEGHNCAVMLCQACASKKFQNQTAHLLQNWTKFGRNQIKSRQFWIKFRPLDKI